MLIMELSSTFIRIAGNSIISMGSDSKIPPKHVASKSITRKYILVLGWPASCRYTYSEVVFSERMRDIT